MRRATRSRLQHVTGANLVSTLGDVPPGGLPRYAYGPHMIALQ